MTYKCVRTCFFNGRLYEKGASADFAASAYVPAHFIAAQTEQAQTAASSEKPKSKARAKKK